MNISLQWHPHHEEPNIVQVGQDLLVVPSLDPQCVARTRRGQRCKKGTISSRTGGFEAQERLSLLWSAHGLLPVWQHPHPSTEILGVWTEQRCHLHETPEATDHTAPEWYRFDPDRDTEFIHPLPPMPRMPTPPQGWSPVSRELAELWRVGEQQHQGPTAKPYTASGWDLEPTLVSPTATAFAALEQILARHHDLPALDWTLTTTGSLGGRLPDEPVTDLNERRFAFATWADRLHAVHRSEHRRKGYLDLRAHTDADVSVPVFLQADIDDGDMHSTEDTPWRGTNARG